MTPHCISLLLSLQTLSGWARHDLQQKRLFSISSFPLGVRTKTINQNISQPQLVSVTDSQPYMVTLLFQFADSDSAQLEMRLLYERVPHHYTPDLGKLDNPIVKYIQVFNTSLDVKYTISDLPKGKYIMCAQIMNNGQVFRSECIDFIIERPVTHSKFLSVTSSTLLIV